MRLYRFGEKKMTWVLITGGAVKLGASLTRALAEKNPVVIHYFKSKDEALQLQESIQKKGGIAETIFGNFSTVDSILVFLNEYQKRFSQTKALIHNASMYLYGSFLLSSLDENLTLWNANFLSGYILSKNLAESLKKQKGSIINLGASGIMNTLSDTRTSFYTLSKMSLLMLTKSLAKELAHFGVRVNMVSPGYLKDSIDLPKEEKLLPMQRTAQAEEVVRAILFLLDPDNSYITGQNIEVSGAVRI